MWEQIITWFKGIGIIGWVGIVAVIIIIVLCIVKKQYGLFKKAIQEAERIFNSGEGQQKLEYAVEFIKSKTPIYLKPFITKKLIVSIIEWLLNKGADAIGMEEDIDIKGNESDIDINTKIKDELGKSSVEVRYDSNEKVANKIANKESDTNIYGAVKAETDFHGKNNASVEIGIQKTL